MRFRIFVVACLMLTTTAGAGIVEHHLYTPTSLPSAQGWDYVSSGLEENAVFAIVGDVLVMDTMGDGMADDTFVWYLRSVADPDVQSAILRLRARVTDYEHNAAESYCGFFFGGHAPGPGWWFHYGLRNDAVYVNDSYLQDLDTGAWHEYTVVTEGLYPDTRSTLRIDGEVAVILTGDSPNGITDAFTFGDSGRNANARVEISEIAIITFDGAPVAVEPRSLSAIRSLFAE